QDRQAARDVKDQRTPLACGWTVTRRGAASGQRRQEAPRDAFYTASLAALTGRALTILRAGFALKVIASPVKGLVPWRALVAGFLMTTNFAKPGTRNTPFFFS